MKNKGFTLVELITTFALSCVVIILLLNVIVLIKDIYYETNLKTELYVNQANLSNFLNKKFKNNQFYSYTYCSTSKENLCYRFILENNETIELNITENKITFGKYIYNIPKNAKVDMEKAFFNSLSHPNIPYNINHLKVPIFCNLYPNIDFGINLIYFN